jgi:hypothetical protein
MTDGQWLDVRGGDGPLGFGVRTRVHPGETIMEVVGELDFGTASVLDEAFWRNGAVATGGWWSMFPVSPLWAPLV